MEKKGKNKKFLSANFCSNQGRGVSASEHDFSIYNITGGIDIFLKSKK